MKNIKKKKRVYKKKKIILQSCIEKKNGIFKEFFYKIRPETLWI